MTLNNYKELTISKDIDKNGKIVNAKENNTILKKTELHTTLPAIIKELLNSTNAKNFGSKLDLLKNKHKLIYGKKDDFVNPGNCFIFIINPKTNKIADCLSKEPRRKSLINGQIILNIKNEFKGMISIYVETL